MLHLFHGCVKCRKHRYGGYHVLSLAPGNRVCDDCFAVAVRQVTEHHRNSPPAQIEALAERQLIIDCNIEVPRQATALPPRQPAGWTGIVNDPRFKVDATVNEAVNPYERKYQPTWATTKSQAEQNKQNQQISNDALERKRRGF